MVNNMKMKWELLLIDHQSFTDEINKLWQLWIVWNYLILELIC